MPRKPGLFDNNDQLSILLGPKNDFLSNNQKQQPLLVGRNNYSESKYVAQAKDIDAAAHRLNARDAVVKNDYNTEDQKAPVAKPSHNDLKWEAKDADSHGNAEVHRQQKAYLEKRQKERDDLLKQREKPVKIQERKETTTQDFDKRFDNALKMYKVNEKKPTSPRPTTRRARPRLARATSPEAGVTEATVIKGVLGNYEVEEPVRAGPGELDSIIDSWILSLI